MSEELKQELHEWIYKTGCNKKFPIYFHDYPEVNEGLDLLIKIHEAWNTRADEPRCDRCKYYSSGDCEKLQHYAYSLRTYVCRYVDEDFYCKYFERKDE